MFGRVIAGLAAALVAGAPVTGLAIEWTLGAGVGVAPDYEGSDDYEAVPLWNVRAQDLYDPNTFVQILGPKLDSNFIPHDNFRLGLSAQYSLERDDVDDNAVDSLGSTDDGILVGAVVGYDFNASPAAVLGVELDGRFDLAGDIGGLVTARGVFRSSMGSSGKWLVNGSVESTYASGDYMENYFGISVSQAAGSSLNAFDADGGIKDVGLGAGITYRVTDRWSVSGLATVKRLLGDAKDSPVTDVAGDKNQAFAGILITNRF